jgi:alkanesulfonate monooxygenase SsuD/methylene tetrahydromethanopterin reductase-like flavin-dependent oxidoreductase (luciferase family)
MRLPPGYSSIASTKALVEAKFAIRASTQTLESLLDLGMVIAGSPATVRETLADYQKKLGFGTLIAMLQVATLPAELTEKNLRLFATEVAPHLRELASEPVAALS